MTQRVAVKKQMIEEVGESFNTPESQAKRFSLETKCCAPENKRLRKAVRKTEKWCMASLKRQVLHVAAWVLDSQTQATTRQARVTQHTNH